MGVLILAACATRAPLPEPADPLATADGTAVASQLAMLTETVCLPAQAHASLAAYVEARGPAALGLRPAPPPETGWTTTDEPAAYVATRQGACFAFAYAPSPDAAPALIATLAKPIGRRIDAETRAADGALMRRVCAPGTSFAVIEGPGPDGRAVLGVGVPPTARACAGSEAPLPPSVRPGVR